MLGKQAIRVVQSDRKGFVSQISIFGAQEGWSHMHRLVIAKPEGSEQICCGGALQDGGFPYGEGLENTGWPK